MSDKAVKVVTWASNVIDALSATWLGPRGSIATRDDASEMNFERLFTRCSRLSCQETNSLARGGQNLVGEHHHH